MSPLPWVAWDWQGPGQWPPPDDLDLDLNQPPGPPWLEEAAARVRSRLASDHREPVLGHCDREAQNLGWRDGHITVVYDWDSLGIRTEAAIVGAAGTVFSSSTGGPIAAELEDSAALLGQAYGSRCPDWDGYATEVAYATCLWVLLYNARKELASGDTVTSITWPKNFANACAGLARVTLDLRRYLTMQPTLRAARIDGYSSATSACPGLSPTRTCSQIIVEAREH